MPEQVAGAGLDAVLHAGGHGEVFFQGAVENRVVLLEVAPCLVAGRLLGQQGVAEHAGAERAGGEDRGEVDVVGLHQHQGVGPQVVEQVAVRRRFQALSGWSSSSTRLRFT